MAHSKSAEKRIRQNEKRRARNRWRKRQFRGLITEYDELILHGSVEDCEVKLAAIYKKLDKFSTTPTIHKNTAARYKSRLAQRLNKKRAAAAAG